MFVAFAGSLYRKLIENEFNNISNKFINSELTEDTEIISLTKQIGPILYIVNIVNLNKNTLPFYQQNIKAYKNRFAENFDNLNVEHIIMINLLVTIETEDDLFIYIDKEEFMPDEVFYIIPWIINVDSNKLITSKSYVDKVLNIHDLINSVLTENNQSDESKISLHHLEEEVRKETSLETKTEDVYLTYCLMLLNISIWCFMFLESQQMDMTDLLIKFGANSPEHIFNKGQYWRLITSMFIHIGIVHVMYNCFALYLFGNRVEKYFGKINFSVIYITSGIIGSISSVLFTQSISAGASGAIYGLIGAVFALSQQRAKKVDGLSFYIISFIIITGLAFGFLDSQIDNYAHIGGLITGYILGYIFCPEAK